MSINHKIKTNQIKEKQEKQEYYYSCLSSLIGPIVVITSETKLLELRFGTMEEEQVVEHGLAHELSQGAEHGLAQLVEHGLAGIWFEAMKPAVRLLHQQIHQQLQEYFSGTRKEFQIPFQIKGTSFQKSVYQALMQIPYGSTCSYQDIAKAIGNPKASRAVGMANHNNCLPIIIPCHRVIGANKKLVGYAGGLSIKEKLLELESLEV